MKRAAYLGRVSTAQQAHPERYGLKVQRENCYRYAEQNEMAVLADFEDVVSGASEKRPGFYELLARSDEFDTVIVAHIDRIARDAELGLRHIRLIGEAGLELHSATRGKIETGLLTGVEVLISEEERKSIARRLRGGVLARADKKLPPQGVHLWGYRNVPGALPEIDPKAALHVRKLFELASGTNSWREVSRQADALDMPTPSGTGTWEHNNVRRTITNPAYKGQLVWPRNTKTVSKTPARIITIPAIVSESVWQAAQKPAGVGRKPQDQTPLSGHLKCGECGFGFSVQVKHHKHTAPTYYYRCNSRGRLVGKCPMPMIRAADFEVEVEAKLRAALQDDEELRALLQDAEARRAPDPRLVELTGREASFVQAFSKGDLTPDEFSLLRRQVRAEIAAFEKPESDIVYSAEAYRKAAQTLELRELVDTVNATIVLLRDGFRILLGS